MFSLTSLTRSTSPGRPVSCVEQMTVDWDEELRKLNASQYGKRQERDLTKDMNDPEAVKWARKNAKIAQSAVEKSTKQVSVSTGDGGSARRGRN